MLILIQVLDGKSLALIIRDARKDVRRASEIVREHYIGSSEHKIVAFHTELTSVGIAENENVMKFIIRANRATTSLETEGKAVGDEFFVAMFIRFIRLIWFRFPIY